MLCRKLLGVTAFSLLTCLGWSAESPWQNGGTGARFREIALPVGGKPGFTRFEGPSLGIHFTNQLTIQRFTTNQILLNGSGAAAGDVDGDGLTDIFLAGLDRPNGLFRNLGNWKFEEITSRAGVGMPGRDCAGALLADMDGDGDLDLLVSVVAGGLVYFSNDGNAAFTNSTQASGLANSYCGTSIGVADFDGDGDLDIYLATYRNQTLRDAPNTNFRIEMAQGRPQVASVNGRPVTEPDLEGRFTYHPQKGIQEHGEPDLFFINDGHGTFKRRFVEGPLFLDEGGAPLPRLYEWGLSVLFRDLNGDGKPDLYLCNDFDEPDRFWLNTGLGSFRLVPTTALRSTPKSSMGVDAADINRDELDDLIVLDMLPTTHARWITRFAKTGDLPWSGPHDGRLQVTRNTLHLNRGDGTYAELAQLAGVEASDWAWTPIFLDVDLDGFEDLLITTGHGRDDADLDSGIALEQARRQRQLAPAELLNLRQATPAYASPKVAFRNEGNLRFTRKSAEWNFASEGVSHGMCLADLDNDGDHDVIVNSLNGPTEIFRNESPAPRLLVRLKSEANTRGIGSRITVHSEGLPVQSQEIIAGGRYLSSDDPARSFAVSSARAARIEVRWPSGKRSSHDVAAINRIYEITEPAGVSAKPPARDSHPKQSWFEEASALIGHTHHDELFDESARQPFAPPLLAQEGPGLSWGDANGDAWDDLLVTSGRGGSLALFTNSQSGSFSRLILPAANFPVTRDQTAAPVLREGDIFSALVGSSNHEDGMAAGSVIRVFKSDAPRPLDLFPPHNSAVGPIAVSDMDGDGEVEVFVGGRALAGKYPLAASSLLFRRQAGRWAPDAAACGALTNVGLVTAACWSDLNNDAFPELLLACEWDTLKIAPNNRGQLGRPQVPPGFAGKRGWWTSIQTADFNQDGRMDIVAGNWGSNTRYEAWRAKPLRLYYPDLNNDGIPELFEARWVPEKRAYMPWQGLDSLGAAYPSLRDRFRSHTIFGAQSIPDITGTTNAPYLEVNWLETTLFINQGGDFTSEPLPIEAQFAPAMGISTADFDGDGFEDLFLSQNLFAVQTETTRLDGGRGLLLRGNGQGNFSPVNGSESGIRIYGEQRGCAVGDFNGDLRPDLVVGQSRGPTILLANQLGRPGIRVRLQGPPGNPQGFGARVELKTQTRQVTREIKAGAGRLSQDSPALLFPPLSGEREVVVTWPGGKKTAGQISGAKAVARFTGELVQEE